MTSGPGARLESLIVVRVRAPASTVLFSNLLDAGAIA
jgi:hypothetical protein